MSDDPTTPDRSVTAVARTVSILNAFLAEPASPTLSLQELETRTGLFKSVILRYMITLLKDGVIARNDVDGNYRLGIKILQLSAAYERSLDHPEYIREALLMLVEKTGETASFYVRDNDTRVCLFRENSPESLRVNLRPGDTFRIDDTSSGRVLSGMEFSPSSPSAYIARSRGIKDPLTSSISAPVFGVREKLAGALTISGPVGRFDPEDRSHHHTLYVEAAELSRRLGSLYHYSGTFGAA